VRDEVENEGRERFPKAMSVSRDTRQR